MKATTNTASHKILWLSDLHLDRASDLDQQLLLDGLAGIEYDAAVITGDISSATQLRGHLLRIAHACLPRAVYFVTGNHDYYGSSLAAVDHEVSMVCQEADNLYYMDGSQVIDLGNGLGLIGHRGWADARAGDGASTRIQNPDRNHIEEFAGLESDEVMRTMRHLGAESARRIRRMLPLALTRYRHVVILSHVPPLPDVVMYDGNPCAPDRVPHFTNLSMGLAIRRIARAFPRRKVTVLCGHSHSGYECDILPNLTIRSGEARTGKPGWQDVLFY